MLNILVTGGAGYIGSHAVRALVRAGHKVVVVDNLSKGHADAVDKGAKLVVADLADEAALKRLFAGGRFDAVMHFAGSIEVGLSMKEPAFFMKNNVMNGMNLLEAMRFAGVRNIIFSSTAAVYGEPEEIPIREDAALKPTNIYGATKLMFEELLQKYHEFYGLDFIALRYFNASGASLDGEIGQNYFPDTHLIPRMLKTALGKYDFLEIFGNDYDTVDGTCVRDYIHVVDLVDAHLKALDFILKGKRSGVFNLGNGSGFSVKQVLEAAEKIIGRKIPVKESPRREGDPAVLVADASLAWKVLGWKPEYSDLETIVGTAWKWHSKTPPIEIGGR